MCLVPYVGGGRDRAKRKAWIEIEVDGLGIAYQRAGQGPLLLLLHGFFGAMTVEGKGRYYLGPETRIAEWPRAHRPAT